jgi:hypothetical protein
MTNKSTIGTFTNSGDWNLLNTSGTLIGSASNSSGAWVFGPSPGTSTNHVMYGNLAFDTTVSESSAAYRYIGSQYGGTLVGITNQPTIIAAGGYNNGTTGWVAATANNAMSELYINPLTSDSSNAFVFYKQTDSSATDYTFSAGTLLNTQTALGSCTGAGAWTLGTASTTTTHTMNVGASSRAIKFGPGSGNIRPGLTVDNAGGSIAVAMATGAGNPQLNFAGGTLLINNGTYATVSDAADMGTGGGATTVGQVTTAGAWTLGPASTTNTHTFNTSTSSQNIKIAGNTSYPGIILDGSGSGAAASILAASGTTVLAFNQSAFAIAANNYTNITDTSNMGGGGGTNIASATSAGAWTFGDSTATTTSHFFNINANGGYVTTHRNYNATQPLGIIITYPNMAPNDAGKEFLVCADSGTVRLTVRSNGGIANYQANDVNLSDERLKANIVHTSPKLDFICNLQVRDFEYKDKPGVVNTGLIAQEVEALNPLLVQEVGSIQVIDGEEINPKAVRTTEIYHMMIKAIQELKAELDAAKARIATLES